MTNTSHRFGVLEDITLIPRSALLILCTLTCCWGFANNTTLLIFASKIGFPMAVAVCSVTINWKQILSILYYTFLLCGTGCLFFWYRPGIIIEPGLASNYNPDWMDFYLALGLGYALSAFWDHPIRINLIVASAGLASLLPACVMAGYHIKQGNMEPALNSLALYGEYVTGLILGALAHQWMEYLSIKINSLQRQ